MPALPTHCIKCPAHRTERDPDPHDSFCRDDMALTCGFIPWEQGHRTGQMNQSFNFRPVSIADRPYQLKHNLRPSWCPLLSFSPQPEEAPNAD